MVSERTLRAWYSSVFVAGATLGGGPPAGIAAAAFLKTELGESGLDDAVKWTGKDSTTKGEQRKTARRAYESSPSPKPKRKASAYSKRYGAAFRKVAPKFKLKNGSWKKNGYRSAVRAAHKLAGGKK